MKLTLKTAEFNRTLKQYLEHSRRDLPTVLNTKAFFIARRAVIETPKAQAADVRRLISRKGEILLGKIINKRRGEKGLPGLYGDAMQQMQLTVVAARRKSIAFLKSGWLPAIRRLEPYAEKRGAPRKPGKDIAQIGQAKGEATPARPGWKIFSQIVNAADADKDSKAALLQYGGPALQRAFDFEVKSMREYIERKLKAAAKRVGIKAR